MKTLTFIQAIKEALHEEMKRDPNMFIFGEDVGGTKGGVFGATEGLTAEFGEDRVLNSPLAESCIAGVGVGAGMYGMTPVLEMQFADYILPAMNQIISEAAKIRYRSNGTWSCPITIRAPFGGGVHGGFYHSQSVEALFNSTPGLKVVIPSNPYDAKGLLKAAIRDPDPVLFFEHKKAYRLLKGEIPSEEYVLPIGKVSVKKEGSDLTIITYGLCVHMSLEVIKELEKENISIHLVDLQTIYPLDKQGIIEAAKKTGKVLLITEDNLEGSIIGEVAAIIAENCLFDLDAPIKRLAGPDVPAMPYAKPMEDFFMMNTTKIKEAVLELAKF